MTRRATLAFLILILAFGCKRKPSAPPDVVVRVGDRMITLADFKRYLERNAGAELAQMQPEVASAMLDQYVEEVILSEHAAANGIEVPADAIAAAVRNEAGATVIEKRDEMRRQKLIASVSADVPDASEEQVREYYERHLNDFRSGEEVRVRQILVRDEALASQIVANLRKGSSFEDLSLEHSLAPNSKKGGDIGFISRGDLPKMFEDEIFALKAGAISNVIKTDNSFHIFKVDERRAPGAIEFDAAAPVIRSRLREDAIRERIAQLVGRTRKDLLIGVLTRRLPFNYSGTLPRQTE